MKSLTGVKYLPFWFGNLTGTATYYETRGTYLPRSIESFSTQILTGAGSGTSGSISAVLYQDPVESTYGPNALTPSAKIVDIYSGPITAAGSPKANFRSAFLNYVSGSSGKYSDRRSSTIFDGDTMLKVQITVLGSGTVAFNSVLVWVGYTEVSV